MERGLQATKRGRSGEGGITERNDSICGRIHSILGSRTAAVKLVVRSEGVLVMAPKAHPLQASEMAGDGATRKLCPPSFSPYTDADSMQTP